MARSRNIKPGFFSNDELAELPALTRLLFIALWTIVDRDGRIEDRPKKIKAEALPYDDVDVDSMLQALHERGFVLRYTVAGIKCLQVVNWSKHQNPHVKEQASTIPAPDKSDASPEQAPKEEKPYPKDAGLIPSLLIPDSLSLDSSPLIPDPTVAPSALSGKPARKRAVKPPAPSAAVWESYKVAYAAQYGCEPVRNASVNAQLALVVGKLGAEEAPSVAAFFVGHRNGLYVSAMHPVTLLLRDAEKLRTEWATGRQVTRTQGQQADRTQTNANAFAPLLAAATKEASNA
jgi:hypothetical protein